MTTRLANLRVGAGISTRRSGLAATEDALGAALAPLDGAIPDLAFLFVAPQFEDELESIVESANASLGGGNASRLRGRWGHRWRSRGRGRAGCFGVGRDATWSPGPTLHAHLRR